MDNKRPLKSYRCNEKMGHIIEECQPILEYTFHISNELFQQQDQIFKTWPTRCVNPYDKEVIIIDWILGMQECGLLITL